MNRNVGQCENRIRKISLQQKLVGFGGYYRLQKIRNDDIRQALCNQTTLLDKVVQRRLLWFGHLERMSIDRIPHIALYMQDSKENETKADPDYDG